MSWVHQHQGQHHKSKPRPSPPAYGLNAHSCEKCCIRKGNKGTVETMTKDLSCFKQNNHKSQVISSFSDRSHRSSHWSAKEEQVPFTVRQHKYIFTGPRLRVYSSCSNWIKSYWFLTNTQSYRYSKTEWFEHFFLSLLSNTSLNHHQTGWVSSDYYCGCLKSLK